MKTKVLSLIVLITTIAGCNSRQSAADKITGTYVREYSFDQVNLDTDKSIGKASVRDTIFIIRAAVTLDRHLPCWLMRCATGDSAPEAASDKIFNQEFFV